MASVTPTALTPSTHGDMQPGASVPLIQLRMWGMPLPAALGASWVTSRPAAAEGGGVEGSGSAQGSQQGDLSARGGPRGLWRLAGMVRE
jgi:hypothetical protein